MTDDFAAKVHKMLLNDPTVTAMCERIAIQERTDLERLDDRDIVSYRELRAQGRTHGDAIAWLNLARPLRLALDAKETQA